MSTNDPYAALNWLKERGITPGPYATTRKWSLALFKGLVTDPKLHGCRLFRRTKYTWIYATGKHRRERNFAPEHQHVPELAHMSREDQESMLAAVGWKIDWGTEVPQRPHKRRGIPNRKSLWPGRHARCSVCKGEMVINGDHLRCPRCLKKNGATCWNRVQVPLDITRAVVEKWIVAEFEAMPSARTAFVDAAWDIIAQNQVEASASTNVYQTKLRRLNAQRKQLVEAIAIGTELGRVKVTALLEALGTLEDSIEKATQQEDKRRKRQTQDSFVSCKTKADLERMIGPAIAELMKTSFSFNDIMRKFFPEFVIVPVQALDSGQVHPRAKLRLRSSSPEDAAEGMDVLFDVFEYPTHIAALPAVMELVRNYEAAGKKRPSYKKIGELLGIGHMTVKRAFGYAKLMEAAGTTDPFRELTEPPGNASRWRTRDVPRV